MRRLVISLFALLTVISFGFPLHTFAIIECDKEAVLKNNLFYIGGCSEVAANTYSNACYALGSLPGANLEDETIIDAINSYLDQNAPDDSPLRGLGAAFVQGASAVDLNPLLLVGIARSESAFGTAGPRIDETHNSFSRVASSDEPAVEVDGTRWYQYESFEASLNGEDNQATFITTRYINRFNITTLYDFVSSYAPDLDDAGRQNYVELLEETIDAIVETSDDAASFGCSVASSSGSYEDNVAAGQRMAAARGWTGDEWQCLFELWTGESGWLHLAINDAEGNNDLNRNRLLDDGETISETEHDAYGIPQSLPGGKMASIADDWRHNPVTQIEWGLGYIAGRYNTPCNAYSQWLSRSPHWY
jgi:hypothetical protein